MEILEANFEAAAQHMFEEKFLEIMFSNNSMQPQTKFQNTFYKNTIFNFGMCDTGDKTKRTIDINSDILEWFFSPRHIRKVFTQYVDGECKNPEKH